VVDNGFNLGEFASHLAHRLPPYARPVFVRISAALDTTETFKQKKQLLIGEGFDCGRIQDPLFFRDEKSGAYLPLDAAAYARIGEGSIRL
jgi:fatty-acyl-CoA synthase